MPETINGFRPDVIATRGSQKTVIEVETEDSSNNQRDLDQQKAFKEWANRSNKRHYRREIAR